MQVLSTIMDSNWILGYRAATSSQLFRNIPSASFLVTKTSSPIKLISIKTVGGGSGDDGGTVMDNYDGDAT